MLRLIRIIWYNIGKCNLNNMASKKSKEKLPKVSLYRNISISFIVFTALLFFGVLLFFYDQASIVIEPEQQEINLSFNVRVKGNPTADEVARGDFISGELVSATKSGKKKFEVLSSKTVDSEVVGRVKLINNSASNQPLLRTTQLQADNGVIVRTSEYVVVPARGSIIVDVYPKDPESFADIVPGRLNIIKLNPNLQDDIYGIAESALTDNPREVRVLSENDINRAKQELTEELIAQTKEELGLVSENKVVSQVIGFSTDKEVGEQVDDFFLELEVELKSLVVDENQLADLITSKLADLNFVGVDIDEVNIVDLDYLIIDEDESGDILAKINYMLKAKISQDNPALDKDNLVDQPLAELRLRLIENDLIKDVFIQVSPYWSKKTPKNPDKISIIIK